MKKYFLVSLFSIVSSLLLAQQQPKTVVATASIFADMASVIAGDLVTVKTIVPIGGDPHLYDPTPADAKLVSEADLILKNGLTFEGWLNKLIDNSGTTASVALITTGVEAIESQTYQNSTDPHAWMDARNGLIYIENIKNALVQLDPDNTDKYVFNYNYYRQQIEDLNHYIQTEIAKIPTEQRIIITSHDAFQYYGRAYGLRLEAVLGTSTDAEVQVSDIKRLTEVIRNSGIPAVFVETTVNPQLLQQIAADNNITIGGKLYSDSLGDKDSPASTYLDMLTYNTRTIVQALARPARSPKVTEDTTSQEESSSSIPLYAALGVLLIGSLLFVARKMG